MDPFSLVIGAVLLVLISTWLSLRKSVKNPLPGPRGLPIVGYLPFMSRRPYVNFTELSKKYGPVFSVQLGLRKLVVICDFKLIREAFASEVFIGRPTDLPFDLSETTLRTNAFNGPPWKEQRRFSLHMLRDLGIGKTKMEEHIKEEIEELLDRLSQLARNPLKMSDVLAPSMSNNIASLIFGKRLKYDDPKRKELDRLLSDTGKLAGAVGWQIFFPWISKTTRALNIGSRGKLSKGLQKIIEFCKKELAEHEATLDPNNIRDFMDGYLLEIQNRSHEPNSPFHRDVLMDLSRAFFGAGSETVRITVDWVLLVCAAYPSIQDKIHAEIMEVLGPDAFPRGQDRQNMPVTEAAILETMRWKSIIPLNIMRSTLADTELNGYHIPKNSSVLAVFWTLDHDEALWGKDVFDFKLERFLSEDRKKVLKPDHFIPFSTGKRACPGKSLAEVEVFLYVTAILQKFKVSLPPGKEADLEGDLGIGLQPKRQDLILEFRQTS